MGSDFKITTLERNGKCVGCGKEVKRINETVIRFSAHKSQVYGCTLCFDCVKKLNDLITAE